jgi:hypothetical protein
LERKAWFLARERQKGAHLLLNLLTEVKIPSVFSGWAAMDIRFYEIYEICEVYEVFFAAFMRFTISGETQKISIKAIKIQQMPLRIKMEGSPRVISKDWRVYFSSMGDRTKARRRGAAGTFESLRK